MRILADENFPGLSVQEFICCFLFYAGVSATVSETVGSWFSKGGSKAISFCVPSDSIGNSSDNPFEPPCRH